MTGARKSATKEIIFKRACSHIKKADEYCIKYAKRIDEHIPQKECNKNKLIAIVLADGITNNEGIISVLHSKLKYLEEGWGSSDGLDAYAYESYCHYTGTYISMIDAIRKYLKE